jgi:hypothetical protein
VTTLGWVGVGLLVAGGLAIVVESVVAAWWGMAIARRALTLSQRLETERRLVESDLEKLRLALEETKRLWRPYRLILRWVRHPLVIALLGSYRRRWLLR